MPRSRIIPPKPITSPTSGSTPTATYGDGDAQRPQQSNGATHEAETPSKQLAPDDAHGHDSDGWSVSDDWPEFVPITVDEVEAIDAFLRDALDELLK